MMSLYGIGFIVTVTFALLQLFGAIDWSWLWVLSPAWIAIGLSALVAFVITRLR